MTDAVRPQRRWLAPFATGAVLFLIYAATVAPTVTFWDAGELIAAAHSLGIPHPPGTPLFILLLSTWGRLFGFLPFALATNLFSAAATAMAGALTCALVAHAFRERLDWSERDATFAGIASAIAAGSMSTAWSNATETELYGASLCLAIATLWCAAQATVATDGSRWRLLVAYLFGLAAPLHVSALIAAPAAIYLARGGSRRRAPSSSRRPRPRRWLLERSIRCSVVSRRASWSPR
jgi:hypothetical protein